MPYKEYGVRLTICACYSRMMALNVANEFLRSPLNTKIAVLSRLASEKVPGIDARGGNVFY
jgi:hypothetical protein